ncbi:hypothetical protein ACQKWADRAFT_312775 [Trichoderma austrokoningii]
MSQLHAANHDSDFTTVPESIFTFIKGILERVTATGLWVVYLRARYDLDATAPEKDIIEIQPAEHFKPAHPPPPTDSKAYASESHNHDNLNINSNPLLPLDH